MLIENKGSIAVDRENKVEEKRRDEFEICGLLVRFRPLTLKDELDIDEILRSKNFTAGSVGVLRAKNLYTLAKGIKSIDLREFGSNFEEAVDWLINLDSLIFDYFVQAWERFVQCEIARIERIYLQKEIVTWPVPVNPREVGKEEEEQLSSSE